MIKGLILRISNKYGSLTRNKFLIKSVTTLNQHDVHSKYASLSRFEVDVCWLVKIQFDRRIDVWSWCLISRKISDQWCARLGLKPCLLGHNMFGWVIVWRQLHFHIYYLFVGLITKLSLKILSPNVYVFDDFSWWKDDLMTIH
jgi:hypothetical protein